VGQKGFVPLNPAQVLLPIMIFQALSFVTGQYYLHNINSRLQSIENIVKRLEGILQREKVAILKEGYSRLEILWKKPQMFQEDLIELTGIISKAGRIAEEHTLALESNENDASLQDLHKRWRTVSKLNDINNKLPSPLHYAEMSMSANRLKYAAVCLSLKGNSQLATKEPDRLNNLEWYLENIERSVNELKKAEQSLVYPDNYLNKHEEALKAVCNKAYWRKDTLRALKDLRAYKKHKKYIKEEFAVLCKNSAEFQERLCGQYEDRSEIYLSVNKNETIDILTKREYV
jgi:hypothetical protein